MNHRVQWGHDVDETCSHSLMATSNINISKELMH